MAIVPELAALLPPEAPPQAHPYSSAGLSGQQARATVYIEEVILPQAEEGVHERPKTALYHVTYRWVPNMCLGRDQFPVRKLAHNPFIHNVKSHMI